jgi:hypothetical protein
MGIVPKMKQKCSVKGMFSQKQNTFVLFMGIYSHNKTNVLLLGTHSHNRKFVLFMENHSQNRTKLFCFWENIPKTSHFEAL